MRVEILTRKEAIKISSEQWDYLSDSSKNINPFFERWCLSPALKYLDCEKELYVVVAYIEDQLSVLFPIHIRRHALRFRYISVWQHSQCFFCEPLCINRNLLYEVIHFVMVKMGLSIIRLPIHEKYAFGQDIDSQSISFPFSRGVVSNFSELDSHFEKLPRRTKLENKRIVNRLFSVTGALYICSRKDEERNWLEDYCQLENSGWKGRTGGSIQSTPDVYSYYQEVYNTAINSGRMEFQGLFNQCEVLAISLRICSKNKGFDLKTSYNEMFKELYPGVVLEIQNLKALSNSAFEMIDSCATPGNRLINRIWPEQRNIQLSYYFDRGFIGRVLRWLYKLKIKKTYQKTD